VNLEDQPQGENPDSVLGDEYPEEPADENQQRILANDRLVDLYAASLLDARQPLPRAVASLWEAHVEEIKRRIARDRSGRRKFSDVEAPGKKLSNEKKKVLLIENDEDVAWDYKIVMENVDFEVWWVCTTDQALRTAATFRDFDAVVMDIRMPPGKAFNLDQTVLGRRTGVELAKELINELPDTIFVALSNSNDALDVAWFEGKDFGFAHKANYPPNVFARYLRRKVFDEKPRIFILHGHDLKSATDLRDYLQDTLKFDQPIILKDQVSGGDTVIEKFEDFAEQSDIVFALFTPDDPGSSTGQARARQNVLFEFGFFIAKFGRKSGKVIFLCKKGVEIPSDLSGWIPIDISDGIWAASNEIRRELQEYLD